MSIEVQTIEVNQEEDQVRGVEIVGFDEVNGWDPEVVIYEDNNIQIIFPEFPPDRLESVFSNFDDLLKSTIEEQIGCECDVYWEDRELFWVSSEECNVDILFDATVEVFVNWK